MPRTDPRPVLAQEEPEGCIGTCFACVPACERRKPEPGEGFAAEAASEDEAPTEDEGTASGSAPSR